MGDFASLSTAQKLVGNWFRNADNVSFRSDGSIRYGNSADPGGNVTRQGIYVADDTSLQIAWSAGRLLPSGNDSCSIGVTGSSLTMQCADWGRLSWTRDECFDCDPPGLVSVSAATFSGKGGIAPGSIASAFGQNLAPGTASALSATLPTILASAILRIRDASGAERDSPLFFVSPTQINCLVPSATVAGLATTTVLLANREVTKGAVLISSVAPGLFTANGNGQGVAAAQVLTVGTGGAQTIDTVFRCGSQPGTCTESPIDLSGNRQVYLILYGTGIRNHRGAVTATVGGIPVSVTAALAQTVFAGLDQVNIGPLPVSLSARGKVPVTVTADGKASNAVSISIR